VPPSQGFREGVVRVPIHRLPQDRLLLLDKTVHGLLQLRALSLAFVGLASVHAGQLRVEDRSPLQAEDAVGQEGSSGVEERVFAQVERLRVAEVVVRPATVVVARAAQVVGTFMADFADHARAARAVNLAAEQIGPLRLRVRVRRVARARPLLALPATDELVVHPLRNERLVGGLRRPDPPDRVVVLASAGPGGAAVVDLVAGELRVPEDVVDARPAPTPLARRPPGGLGGGCFTRSWLSKSAMTSVPKCRSRPRLHAAPMYKSSRFSSAVHKPV
jgi:hypothetical protein